MTYKLTFTCARCGRKSTIEIASGNVWPTQCHTCRQLPKKGPEVHVHV